MRGSRTTFAPWELPHLKAIIDGQTREARVAAMHKYAAEMEVRRRYARVRDQRDRKRRTLVGAHMPQEQAYMVAKLAEAQGLSVTAYVKRALDRTARADLARADPQGRWT